MEQYADDKYKLRILEFAKDKVEFKTWTRTRGQF